MCVIASDITLGMFYERVRVPFDIYKMCYKAVQGDTSELMSKVWDSITDSRNRLALLLQIECISRTTRIKILCRILRQIKICHKTLLQLFIEQNPQCVVSRNYQRSTPGTIDDALYHHLWNCHFIIDAYPRFRRKFDRVVNNIKNPFLFHTPAIEDGPLEKFSLFEKNGKLL